MHLISIHIKCRDIIVIVLVGELWLQGLLHRPDIDCPVDRGFDFQLLDIAKRFLAKRASFLVKYQNGFHGSFLFPLIITAFPQKRLQEPSLPPALWQEAPMCIQSSLATITVNGSRIEAIEFFITADKGAFMEMQPIHEIGNIDITPIEFIHADRQSD